MELINVRAGNGIGGMYGAEPGPRVELMLRKEDKIYYVNGSWDAEAEAYDLSEVSLFDQNKYMMSFGFNFDNEFSKIKNNRIETIERFDGLWQGDVSAKEFSQAYLLCCQIMHEYNFTSQKSENYDKDNFKLEKAITSEYRGNIDKLKFAEDYLKAE